MSASSISAAMAQASAAQATADHSCAYGSPVCCSRDYAADLCKAVRKGEEQQQKADIHLIKGLDIAFPADQLKRMGIDDASAQMLGEQMRRQVIRLLEDAGTMNRQKTEGQV